MEYPKISILVPVYKRNKFLSLLLFNLAQQKYPHHKITLIIDECKSDEPFIEDVEKIRDMIKPIKLQHHVNNNRRSIGEKRNNLVKLCKTKIFAFMDSDDLYQPTYLTHSYEYLTSDKQIGVVGSDKMLFVYPRDNFKITYINCGDNVHMIHEATMVGFKKFFNSTCKFKRSSRGEGGNLFEGLKDHQVKITDVRKCMICVCHDDNTVNKDMFNREDKTLDIPFEPSLKEFILKCSE
jgi:glycosyltransferase involved in cell wall biosynthesis